MVFIRFVNFNFLLCLLIFLANDVNLSLASVGNSVSYEFIQTDGNLQLKVDQLNKETGKLISAGNLDAALNKIEEARFLLESGEYTEGEAKTEAHFGNLLLAKGRYDTAAVVLEKSYRKYKDTESSLSLGNMLATAYRHNTELQKAMSLYSELLERAETENDLKFQSAIRQNLAVIYENLGDRSEALEQYLLSLEITESRSDTATKAILLNNVADLYNQMENYNEAELYFQQALEIAKILDSPKILRNIYVNYGVHKRALKEYDKALEFYDLALEYAAILGDEYTPVQTLFNKGNIYLDNGMLVEANLAFTKSLDKSRELNIAAGEIYNYIGLGDIEVKLERYPEAIDYFESALDRVKKMGSKSLESPLLERLSEAYEASGNYKSAYGYSKSYHTLSDSLSELEKDKELARFETLLGLKSEQEQNNLLQEKISAQNLAMIIGAISILLLLIAAFALYRMYNRQREYISGLKEKNDELNNLYTRLEEQRNELASVNETKDKLFSVLAHDLRSPIAKLYSLLLIIREEAAEEINLEESLNQLELQLNSGIYTLENYLNWAQSQMEGISPNMNVVDVHEQTEKVFESLQSTADAKSIQFKNEIKKETHVTADPNLMDIILRNLITNGIKFSHPDSCINCGAEKIDDKIRLSVSDTGVGIPEQVQDKLFKAFNGTQEGTARESGTGLGLAICKEFTELQNGNIWFESIQGKGTKFYVELQEASEKRAVESLAT